MQASLQLSNRSLRDVSDAEWDQIRVVYLKGAYSCTKATLPIFRKQKFGRIVITASAAGLYGNFGQANYSTVKVGLVAFTKTLTIEAPSMGSRLLLLRWWSCLIRGVIYNLY